MKPSDRRSPETAPHSHRARIKSTHANYTRADHPAETILSRLSRVKPTGPGTWLASCPTEAHHHGDRSRGLSIRELDDGRVLLHCHAGCDVHAVLDAIGLQPADLFPPRPSDYPHLPDRHRPRTPRVPWPDLFQAIGRDLRVCSLAFSDLAAGKPFTPTDAATIARLAGHLADEISEVRHAG